MQFEGRWALSRQVQDFRDRSRLAFEGEATFRRDAEGLALEESGRWTEAKWGGLTASRRYLWRAFGPAIDVFYADGRFFHRFDLVQAGRAKSRHDCPPDRYDVTYRFDLPSAWEAAWRVKGPAKDYLSRTRYRRR
ncbi:hypothetical protein ROA7023_02478 [Roseisalinus antarcticus]|uniref:DUF6314 domain-containing protein n=2 Tax=Roseisalinus antarcticus TaxID=254357 RepID=A0A1Y5T8W0_9RHOB|nr:hypothetical protein ROA7023_02478 [Roseisalinus antarcticus]